MISNRESTRDYLPVHFRSDKMTWQSGHMTPITGIVSKCILFVSGVCASVPKDFFLLVCFLVVVGGFGWFFGSFWVVPCWSNYGYAQLLVSSDKVACLFVAFMKDVYRSTIKTMNSKTKRYISTYNNIKDKRENFRITICFRWLHKELRHKRSCVFYFFSHCMLGLRVRPLVLEEMSSSTDSLLISYNGNLVKWKQGVFDSRC